MEASAGGATDFAAFNALVRSERAVQQQRQQSQLQDAPLEQQQQQQQLPRAGCFAAPAAPPRPPRQPVAVTTFDAITSARLPEGGADHEAQLEAIRSLYDFGGGASSSSRLGPGGGNSVGDSLSGWPARPGPPDAADGGAQKQKQQQFDLDALSKAPWDWALKARVRVASAAPLSCLEDAAAAGLAPSCRAAAGNGAAGGSAEAGGGASAAPSEAERLAAALLQWQHPAQPLSADAVAVMAASASTRELLSARVRAWRDSLRGLWAAVRHGQCAAAYVVGATVSDSTEPRGGRAEREREEGMCASG